MSAGTITLTNGSAIVGGSGTSFAAELAAGDFIVSTVGGVTYTLPVKSVESNAQLTLVSNFTGPTQSGAAWSAIPRVALNMVTAALVAQSAEALRGLNYDKQNWQSIFSGTGNVTVTLPDGTTWAGPAWNSITSSLNSITESLSDKAEKGANDDITSLSGLTTALSVAQGGTGSTNASGARTSLGLGTAATKNIQDGPYTKKDGAVLSYADYGIGYFKSIPANTGAVYNGFWKISDGSSYRHGMCFAWADSEDEGWQLSRQTGPGISGAMHPAWRVIFPGSGYQWYNFYSTANTTVSSDGSIKSASPVVKIFHDGDYETNAESEGVTVSRLSRGVYLIRGCEGLNSDPSWSGIDGGFDIPADRNKQPLIWLDYEVNADGSLLVKTYHRTHPSAPSFARNERDGLADGDPVDIPADQFVSVRVEMPVNSIWNKHQNEAGEAALQEPAS